MDGVNSIQLDVPDFRSSVLTHLNSLRVQGRLCDIIVQVEGHSFRAHKVVLAASSPYFRDHMSLSQMSTVSLSVIRNPGVFEQLLTFCYTGRLRLQLCDIISYLTAASFLQMQHIIDRCTQILEGIHLKISLSDVDDDITDDSGAGRRGSGLRGGVARRDVISPQRSERPRGGGLMARGGGGATVEDAGSRSPEDEEEVVGSAGGGAYGGVAPQGGGGAPILRINRAGQWYVETAAAMLDSTEAAAILDTTVHIKTEDEWTGGRSDAQDEADRGRVGRGGVARGGVTRSGVARGGMAEEEEEEEEEEGPAGMIDMSGGRSSVGANKAAQPTSSFHDTDSPTGSVVVVSDSHRAKSESPGGMDEHHQPSSQGEGPMALEVGGYEEYLRDQVGGDSRWFRYNPRLTCIYCCKSFNQKGSLDRHMRLHMGITPFVCRICGKKYTRKDQLEYHIRKHTGNKPFHCHLCGKSFPFQAILNQHFRKNHPGCSAPPSQTERCERQQTPHSSAATRAASPETTTSSLSSSAGGGAGGAGGGAANQSQEEAGSPPLSREEEEEAEPRGGGDTPPQASGVSTTGPD